MKSGYYYSASQALQELGRRQNGDVRKVVEDWWIARGIPRAVLPEVPNMAVLARHVATARFEDIVFREMAVAAGFTPVWLEHTTDKFVSRSPYKRSLVVMGNCTGRTKAEPRWKRQHIACITSAENKALDQIRTHEGGSLIEHHHALQERVLGPQVRADMSPYLATLGRASEYYAFYLSWFVAHGVLFEDYHGGETGSGLTSFTDDVFVPAWQQVVDELGIQPIIVPMPWWKGMELYPSSADWAQYGIVDPAHITRLVA